MDTLPLFVSGLAFMVCLLYSLGCFLAGKKSPRSRRGLIVLCFGVLCLFPFAIVGPPLYATVDNVSGTYRGSYGEMVLLPNGTFKQRAVGQQCQTYNNAGAWRLDNEGLDTDVTFDHLLVTKDVWGQPQTPKLTDGTESGNLEGLFPHIVFNDDTGVEMHKTAGDTSALSDIPAYEPPLPAEIHPSDSYTITVVPQVKPR